MNADSNGGSESAGQALAALTRLRALRGVEAASAKLVRLEHLAATTLSEARQVRLLHELLCFLRAYPDDRKVLRAATRMLTHFATRRDLRRHARTLADTGIAGTAIHYAFYYPTACWLAARWPDSLTIDWARFERIDALERLLPLLLPYAESMTLDEAVLAPRALLARLKGGGETDAVFLIRRLQALDAPAALRQKLFEDLDVPMVLRPARDTPSRTASRLAGAPVFLVTGAAARDPDWRRMRPRRIESLSVRRGAQVLELARIQMITRSRDLYAFMHGSPRGVRLFHMGDGLQFACIGLDAKHRFMLETLYVYLALQSGIPVGYVQATAFLRSVEINFNIFDSFRGAQAKQVFRAVLAMVRRDIGCDTFIMNTQQLGDGNDEALRTGAWWFYHKLGFRPRDPDVTRLMTAELRKMRKDPGHRTDRRTLKRLAASPLYLCTGPSRRNTVNDLAVENIGLVMSTRLARRFGSEREAALEVCSREAVSALGLEREPATSRHERMMWRRWAPLVLALPGLAGWSDRDKCALAEIIVAKGAASEARYLRLIDAHPRLRRALLRLARIDAGR